MRRDRGAWVGFGLAASVVLGGACLIAQGPLPGDVAVTRLLQEVSGGAAGWARLLTASARTPALWLTLLVATGLAFVRGGVRAAVVPSLSLPIALIADRALRALVFAPRPDAALVRVDAAGAGSGLPSTFALVYGALFGAVVLARLRVDTLPRAWATLAPSASAGLIAAGCGARVVLGGHWTSQVLASLVLAFTIVLLVQNAIDALRPRD